MKKTFISFMLVWALSVCAAVGQTYEIIVLNEGEFAGKYADENFWEGLLSPESAYYWNLTLNDGVVLAALDPNAIPEPSTWALLILGAAGLLYWRKKNA